MTEDHITEHFLWSEAQCHDGTEVPDELRVNVVHLCAQLEVLRAHVGPLIVNDLFRTASHNAAVGGAPHSQHLLAKAADVRSATMTAKALHAVVEALIASGELKINGVGEYASFVHVDTRDGYARWRG